jgi:hypothetical protein
MGDRDTPAGDLDPLVASWIRVMRARNLSPKTVRNYTDSPSSSSSTGANTAASTT